MQIYSNLLIFLVQTQCKQNVSKCNKKPTGNIGYILTAFEETKITEVTQLMQQMLLYCKVLF